MLFEVCHYVWNIHLMWPVHLDVLRVWDLTYTPISPAYSSVSQFSHSVMSNSLQLLDCSTPGFPAHYQLPELAQTHVHQVGDAIQPSHPFVPFSSCLQSFPASGSFSMNQFLISHGQSIGASASILPMNIQGWFPLGLTSLISLLSEGPSRVFSCIQMSPKMQV